MHLYFITRGPKHWRDLFIDFMHTFMWKWKRKNLKTNKEEICQVQGSLRPIELWEYVFPEECLDEVLTVIKANETKHVFKGARGVALRKALGKGVKPIPDHKEVKTNKYAEKNAVAVYPVGIKKDERRKVEEWGYEQEML